jgi:YD repeat-containing protein
VRCNLDDASAELCFSGASSGLLEKIGSGEKSMATATFDLWQASLAAPVIWGAVQDTTAPGFIYQAAPFLTKNEPPVSVQYLYDALGRLIQTSFLPQGTTVATVYDAAGNRKSAVTTQGLGGL